MAEPNDFVVAIASPSPALESPAAPTDSPIGEPPASAADPEETRATEPSPTDDEQPDDEEADAPPRKASNLDKRFRRLTGRLRERDTQIARLEAQVETLLRTQAPVPVSEPAAIPPGTALRPEQFPSYEAYIEALVQTRAETVVATTLQQQETERRQQAAHAEMLASQQDYESRVAAAKQRHPDYDEVLDEATYPVSQHLLDELRTSEEGPELAYYLAQHPEEGQRLSQLPPGRLARELGRLEATLSVTTPAPAPRTAPAVSTRPRPLTPVSGASTVSTFDPATASLEEYRAWRAKGGGR